ncbi:phage/plasmid primase, P4 family [Rhodococcus erythropolis]|uniref:DNA primase family protein n=1 Tax=Rhodococcus erythropolis TaxID=1833 RepID=UPI0033B6FFDF
MGHVSPEQNAEALRISKQRAARREAKKTSRQRAAGSPLSVVPTSAATDVLADSGAEKETDPLAATKAAMEVDSQRRAKFTVTADARGRSDGAYQADFAAMLRTHHYKSLRYVGKEWARYDGKRWVIQKEDVAAYREWEGLRKRIEFAFEDDNGMTKFKPVSGANNMTHGVVASARHLFEFQQGKFDQNPYELNTPAGIMELSTGELVPHESRRLHSRITQVAPDFDAPKPRRFLEFLDQIMLGDSDQTNYLLTLLATCLLGKPGGQYLHIFRGEGGNGKGVVLNLMEELLGIGGKDGAGYYVELEGTYLTVTRSPKHEAENANLHGARVVVVSEFPVNSKFNGTRLKNNTGGNVITASFKGQDPFSFRLAATFLANSNVIPDTSEINNAIKRRLRGVPFDYTHDGPRNDNFYRDLVKAEGGAIMALLCRKAHEFLLDEEQFPPQSRRMIASMADYFENQDVVKLFLEECCLAQDGAQTLNSDLKAAFQGWCDRQDILKRERITGTNFMSEIKKRGYKIDDKRRDPATGELDGRRRTRGLAIVGATKLRLRSDDEGLTVADG